MESLCESQSSQRNRPRFETALAISEAEVLEAQRLRYRVFALEMGASMPHAEAGLDRDEFDPFCEHLIVREAESHRVVGTYRMLSAAQATHTGGFYSQREFFLDEIATLSPKMVELGRACVDPDYRTGAVIATLWAGLCSFILERRYEYVIGCGSVPLNDGGRLAASIYDRMRFGYLSPPHLRAYPRCPFPLDVAEIDPDPPLPPLLKGYLRLGAYVCGEPARDTAFKTADMLIMLPMQRLNPRYLSRFGRQS
ncbi:MAG TPA: GNAT family N-acyltransferase [Candidatus Binataceae bacterium]|nr:GNAT family N-acyltransferase [Candidatus Binataceae bacterium]